MSAAIKSMHLCVFTACTFQNTASVINELKDAGTITKQTMLKYFDNSFILSIVWNVIITAKCGKLNRQMCGKLLEFINGLSLPLS